MLFNHTVFRVLQSNVSVEELNLDDNRLGSSGAQFFSEMISENVFITSLVCAQIGRKNP